MPPSLAVQVQGQSSVTADNLNTFVQASTTAAILRGFVGVTGMQVQLGGIAAAGDGLGGLFYWNPTGVAPDDNLNVIVPTGSAQGEWVRVIQPSSGGGGTPGGSDKQVQFNKSGAFGGTPALVTIDDTGASVWGKAIAELILDGTRPSGVADIMTITAGKDLYLKSADGSGGIAPGALLLSAGSGVGTGLNQGGAQVNIVAGTGTNGGGGGVIITAGDGSVLGGGGGAISEQSGNAFGGNVGGGDWNATAGNGNGTGPGGHCQSIAGNGGTSGNGGFWKAFAGDGGSSGGTPGDLSIFGGSANSGNTNGGAVKLVGGVKNGTGVTGKADASGVSVVVLPHYTVATLPAASTYLKYGMAVVTDATAPTYNGTLTGGGTVIVPVFCDGTTWTSH